MTANKKKKKLVRARMEKTGEGYQAAHHAIAIPEQASAPAAPAAPAAPTPTRFELVYLQHRFTLGQQPFVVGREAACDLLLDDARASRRHASFSFANGQARVEDLGAQNGVKVNGTRIVGGAELKHGDVLIIGQSELTVIADGAPLARTAGVGWVLAGRYKLTSVVSLSQTKLGGEPTTHGACELYVAQRPLLGGDVQIKLLPLASERGLPHRRRWLLQEGRAQQRASHPQVLKVFDISETEAGEVFLVFEPPQGMALGEYLEAHAPDERVVHEITRQLAEILEHVHGRGVIHRGLRPGAVHVEERRGKIHLSLSSFGFATIAGEVSSVGRTVVYGHPYWMSPEQCRGPEVDARSDLYSLGVILYAMLAKRVPFAHEDRERLPEMHMNAEPPPLRAAGATPSPLDAICMKLLAKSPDDRYPDASALLDALGR